MSQDWKSYVRRYALAIGILVLILTVQNLLLYFSIKLSFTIPIIVGLVATGWYGGRGPGIALAILIALISAISSPPTQGTTRSFQPPHRHSPSPRRWSCRDDRDWCGNSDR